METDTTRSHNGQPMRAWLLVAGLLILATGAGLLLDRHVSLTSQAMLYVLVVVLASYTLRLLPSMVCALAAVTAFNFFFVPPRWTFEVESQEHLAALVTMLVVALVISQLSANLRRKTELAHMNAARAHQLQDLATGLANAGSIEAAIKHGQVALNAAFDGPSTLVACGYNGVLTPALNLPQFAQDGLASCLHEAAVLGPGTGRWPGLNAWYIPLGSKGHMQGAVCIENVCAADDLGRAHALALCALLAQCLQRLQVTSAMQAAQSEAQRQQIQSTFLAAISHDLRTPLAAVLGAATALQEQSEKLDAQAQQRLLGSIVREASYLTSVTENTLQLVQLGNAAQPLACNWESIEEIAGTVVNRIRQRDGTQRIAVRVPGGLPLIEVDAVLIAQLIGNLLDNALKYSAGSIALVVSATPCEMQVSVKDCGKFIAPELHARIFQPYARNDQSGQRGAGLGLALCRAIALAHGGSLALCPRQGGGNCFTLTLPLNPLQPSGDAP